MARRNLRLVGSRSEDPALQSPECEEAPNGPPMATGCQWLRHLPAVRTRKSCEAQKGTLTIWWRCGFWRRAVEAVQKHKMNLSVLIAWFPHCSPGFGHLLLSLFSTSCLKVGYQKHMFHHKFSRSTLQMFFSDKILKQNGLTWLFNTCFCLCLPVFALKSGSFVAFPQDEQLRDFALHPQWRVEDGKDRRGGDAGHSWDGTGSPVIGGLWMIMFFLFSGIILPFLEHV